MSVFLLVMRQNAGPGEGLIFFGNVILPFVDDFPKDNELYSIMTTKLGETGKGENEHDEIRFINIYLRGHDI